jgi:WD40 repeat protein
VISEHKLNSLAFSADSKWLATGSDDSTIHLYEMPKGKSYTVHSDSGGVYSLAFTPDSRTLVAGTLGGELAFWNVANRREMMTIKAHLTVVNQIALSPDGRWLTSLRGADYLRLWSAPTFVETDENR